MSTRRDILRYGLGYGVLAGTGLAFPNTLAAQSRSAQETIVAQVASAQLAPPEYPATEIWGYDGKAPGPVLRLMQGDRLQRRFVNDLPQATSIHWHGLRIPNAMDGVSGLTQDAVPSGGSFDYDFVLPDAGTYWYHAHNRSVEEVARGLYGALIVEEPQGPDVDRDEVLVLDDWRLNTQTLQIDADFDAPHDRSHGGRFGNLVTVNGSFDLSLEAKRHERLRLRLVNAANARIFRLGLSGLEGWIVALDGMPLAAPARFEGDLILGPGQRADLLVDVVAETSETAHLIQHDNREDYSLATFVITGTAGSAARGTPAPLPENPGMDLPDLSNAVATRLIMEGGAMGRMRGAMLDGNRRSFREIAGENHFWALNGTVGMTGKPLATVTKGRVVRMEVRNDTAFPHAMHLHGMHFREVLPGGGFGPLRDTLMSGSGETHELAFTADNPGKWLLHCHMLSHAASGMMTWLEVT